jgi:anti-sigma regulatory factor (Ser/Thr protein kinase)
MEVSGASQMVPVTEPSQVSAARFLAREIAEQAALDPDDVHRAGLVATELATNLVKHATGGRIVARAASEAACREVELVAIDNGPGMSDVARCLVDGHSTSGSSGTGFGAVRRLSDAFDVFSDPRGTAIVSRVRRARRDCTGGSLQVGAVSLAMPGESVCGDAWLVRRDANGMTILVADGLGHGIDAARAANAALHEFRTQGSVEPVDALQKMHDGMRHTRGAAAAIAAIQRGPMVVRCAGVGNVSTAICHDANVRHAVTLNGTLGHEVRVMREYTYPWFDNGFVVMHSDGLGSHWSLDPYRGLARRHPSVIASILYRDYARGRDDVTVVVVKEAA